MTLKHWLPVISCSDASIDFSKPANAVDNSGNGPITVTASSGRYTGPICIAMSEHFFKRLHSGGNKDKNTDILWRHALGVEPDGKVREMLIQAAHQIELDLSSSRAGDLFEMKRSGQIPVDQENNTDGLFAKKTFEKGATILAKKIFAYSSSHMTVNIIPTVHIR